MKEIVLKCLYDIQLAIAETDFFLEMIPDDFEEYSRHTVIKRAVERNLETTHYESKSCNSKTGTCI